LKSLAPTDFAANICQPPSHDFVEDNKEVQSSGNKEETAADVEDSARKGKEKVEESQQVTKKRRGSVKARGTCRKSLDSCRFEAQRRAALETPSEATTTIQMPQSM
jgi:hypothetical protein